jgi:nicotinate-nucleotide adenylyltransferase
VLGGSFDPIHIGHLQIAIQLLNQQIVDEIYFVPCGERKDKKLSTSGTDRLKITQLAVEEYFQNKFPIYVNDIEVRNQHALPTYDLLC